MAEIRKPAVKIRQGKRILFLTSFTVRDFLQPDFYNVNTLDVQESTGMQRLLNNRRAESFGRDMIKADGYDEAFLPTSVFLATASGIGYDEKRHELFFDTSPEAGVCPLGVVDGQHRIEGLKWAVETKENEHLLDFPISTVIAPQLTSAEQMLQFVVVNTKQERVNTGVAQHIIARFTQMLEVDDVPHLPKWLDTAVKKGDDNKALDIAKKLNSSNSSPWHKRIQFADEDKEEEHSITQKTFVGSIKKYLLARNHPFLQLVRDENKRIAILNNYWTAVQETFTEKDSDYESIVFKSIGLDFFHSISAPVMLRLTRKKSYKVQDFKNCFDAAGNYLGGDEAAIMSPDYWVVGGSASGLNMAATQMLAKAFSDALSQAGSDDDIQV